MILGWERIIGRLELGKEPEVIQVAEPTSKPNSTSALKNAWLMKDVNGMMDTLADEIVRWDKETRAILLSIKES